MSGQHAAPASIRDDLAAWLRSLPTTARDTWTLVRLIPVILTALIPRRVPVAAGGVTATPPAEAPEAPAPPPYPGAGASRLPDTAPGEVAASAAPGAATRQRWVLGPGFGPAVSVTGPDRGFIPVTAVTVTAPSRTIPDGTGRGEHPYPDHLAATVASPAVPDDIPEDWPPGPLVRLYADPRWLIGDTRRIRARELAARVSTADGYGSAIWRLRARTGTAA